MSENNLVVLVDMDSVLVDFMNGWLKAWNAKHPDKAVASTEPWNQFYAEDCFKHLGVTMKECDDLMRTPGFFVNLEPLPGAVEGIRQMEACGIHVCICTSPITSVNCFSEKAEWIEHFLGREWLKRLTITKDKTLVHGNYLIDDKPEITGLFSDDPIWEHVIYDQPYNQHIANKHRITWEIWPTLLIYDSTKHR